MDRIKKSDLMRLIKEVVSEEFSDSGEPDLTEMPVGTINRIGDFDKNSSIRNPIDRKLLASPKAEVKIRKIWEKSPGDFNLVFINDKRVNKPEFREVGQVTEDFVRNKMGISQEELPIDPNATTIIFTNNSGGARVMSSGWILAHRFGHALAATGRSGGNNFAIGTLWGDYRNELTNIFQGILSDVYGLPTQKRFGFVVSNELLFKLAAMQLGTMKSARDKNLNTWYEFAYELFAQYLVTGKIKLNPLPDSILTKVRGFIKTRSNVKDKDVQEMYNRHDLEYYSEQLEASMEVIFGSLPGKIFVM